MLEEVGRGVMPYARGPPPPPIHTSLWKINDLRPLAIREVGGCHTGSNPAREGR